MIRLVTEPAADEIERLERATTWARRLYGTQRSAGLIVTVALPEPVEYLSKRPNPHSGVRLRRSYTPSMQRVGTTLRVHPALCARNTPRFVLRYAVVIALMHFETDSPRLFSIKRRLAPYATAANDWLDKKGLGEQSWDL